MLIINKTVNCLLFPFLFVQLIINPVGKLSSNNLTQRNNKSSVLPERGYVSYPVVLQQDENLTSPSERQSAPFLIVHQFAGHVPQVPFNPRPRHPQTALSLHAMPSLPRATGVVSIHNTPHNKPTRQTHLNVILVAAQSREKKGCTLNIFRQVRLPKVLWGICKCSSRRQLE